MVLTETISREDVSSFIIPLHELVVKAIKGRGTITFCGD